MLILYMVILSLLVFITEAVIFFVLISKKKKEALQNGKEVSRAGKKFVLSHIIAALLILSPLLVRLSITAAAAACLCGILGEFIISKDRLSSI